MRHHNDPRALCFFFFCIFLSIFAFINPVSADGVPASMATSLASAATESASVASPAPALVANTELDFLKNIQRFSSVWIKFGGIHAFRFNPKDKHVRYYQKDFTVPAYTAPQKEKLTWKGNAFSATLSEPVGDQQHTYSINGTIDPTQKTVSLKCSAKAETTSESWTFTVVKLPYQSGEKQVISFYARGDSLKEMVTVNEASDQNYKCRLGIYVETDWTGKITDTVSISRKEIPTLIVTFSRPTE